MLQIIELNPVIGQVWYVDSWLLTSEAVHASWPTDGVGQLMCYGSFWFINSPEDLDTACSQIASWPDPPNGVM